jgi:hypothetical protein
MVSLPILIFVLNPDGMTDNRFISSLEGSQEEREMGWGFYDQIAG